MSHSIAPAIRPMTGLLAAVAILAACSGHGGAPAAVAAGGTGSPGAGPLVTAPVTTAPAASVADSGASTDPSPASPASVRTATTASAAPRPSLPAGAGGAATPVPDTGSAATDPVAQPFLLQINRAIEAAAAASRDDAAQGGQDEGSLP